MCVSAKRNDESSWLCRDLKSQTCFLLFPWIVFSFYMSHLSEAILCALKFIFKNKRKQWTTTLKKFKAINLKNVELTWISKNYLLLLHQNFFKTFKLLWLSSKDVYLDHYIYSIFTKLKNHQENSTIYTYVCILFFRCVFRQTRMSYQVCFWKKEENKKIWWTITWTGTLFISSIPCENLMYLVFSIVLTS